MKDYYPDDYAAMREKVWERCYEWLRPVERRSPAELIRETLEAAELGEQRLPTALQREEQQAEDDWERGQRYLREDR